MTDSDDHLVTSTTSPGVAGLRDWLLNYRHAGPPRPAVLRSQLYDLDRFRSDLLVDIMRTHPKVLMGSTVLENLDYVPPDQLVATHR